MAWVNIFDVGPCEVELYGYDSYIAPEDYHLWGIESVEVVDGEVVVTGIDFGIDYRVVPLFDVSGVPVRVSGVVLDFDSFANDYIESAASWGAFGMDGVVALSREGFPHSVFSPDPADVSPVVSTWISAGVSGGRGG